MRRNFSLVARDSLQFTRCSLLIVKSLVVTKFARYSLQKLLVAKKSLFTRCKILSLLVAEVARCKNHSSVVAKGAIQKVLLLETSSFWPPSPLVRSCSFYMYPPSTYFRFSELPLPLHPPPAPSLPASSSKKCSANVRIGLISTLPLFVLIRFLRTPLPARRTYFLNDSKFARCWRSGVTFTIFIKNLTPSQVFSCEFLQNFKNTYFVGYLRTAASENNIKRSTNFLQILLNVYQLFLDIVFTNKCLYRLWIWLNYWIVWTELNTEAAAAAL